MIVLGIVATLAVAMLFGSTLNTGIEFVAYRPLRNAPRVAPLITAVGMSFLLQNIGLVFWGVNYTSVPRLVPELGRILDRPGRLPVEQARGHPDHAPGAPRAHVSRPGDAAGEGDARDLAGSGSGGDDGRQREPNDLLHVHAGRRPGGRSRCALPPQLHDDPLRPGLPARVDRLHGCRARAESGTWQEPSSARSRSA